MQKLQQKQEQKQTTSLQTIQLMSLLELPVNRLEELIERKLEENPALEIASDNEETTNNEVGSNDIDSQDNSIENEDFSTQNDTSDVFDEEYLDDDYDFRYEHIQNNLSCFDKDKNVIDKMSLQDNLLDQLNMLHLSEKEKEIAQFIVGELEDDGYLKTDTTTMVYDLREKEQIQTNEQELERLIVSVIQSLDPTGVGARNLQECICLQIKRLPINQAVQNALCIVEKHFEDFYKKHYEKLKNSLSMNDENLKAALNVIQHCNPHPTDNSTWLDEAAAQITPDFLVSTENGKIEIVLCHPQIPKLHVNHSFKKEYHFIQNKKYLQQNTEAEAFLKKYVEDAELFIKLLSQREFTLLNVLSVMVDRQSEYFLSGDKKHIKPLLLKNIASELNIDISTVSRATHNKYIRSDFGVLPVKSLFSESIGDQDISSREIKSILEELIQNECKNQPLTDDDLVEALTLKGYKIARRTVAKYREQLHIPVARLRKRINL